MTVVKLRSCIKCGKEKPDTAEFFSVMDHSSVDGKRVARLYPYCKDCSPKKKFTSDGYKTCRMCGESKPKTGEFFRTNGAPGSFKPVCKSCMNRPPAPKPPAGKKVCTSCGQAKPADRSNFYVHGPTGELRSKCIACCAAYSSARNAKPPQFGPDLPPGARACKKCNQLKRDSSADFHVWQSGRLAGTCRKCMAKKAAMYRSSRPAEVAIRSRLIAHERRSGKLRMRLRRHERRAGYHGDLSVTPLDVIWKIDEQSGACRWCGSPLGVDYVIDHIIPLARGGTHSVDNICCACRDCNASKGAKSLDQWQGRPR